MQPKTLSDLRIAWSGLQEELGRRQSQSRAYYAIAQVLCTLSFLFGTGYQSPYLVRIYFSSSLLTIASSICSLMKILPFSLWFFTCFQDIESLSHELGVIRGKEDTCELELLEVRKSHQTNKMHWYTAYRPLVSYPSQPTCFAHFDLCIS